MTTGHGKYFLELYEKALQEAVRKYPSEYVYPQSAIPGVVERMGAAFERGSYNKDSRAIKAVCKLLGIPYTYKGINDYIHERIIKNPQVCEYCRLIHGTLTGARTPKERRRALARFKLHRRMVHKNPPTKNRARIAKAAYRIAYVLYKKFKSSGVPRFIINRIPTDIRPYVVYTLDINGIKVV